MYYVLCLQPGVLLKFTGAVPRSSIFYDSVWLKDYLNTGLKLVILLIRGKL